MRTTIGNHGAGRYYVVDEEKQIKLPSVTTILGEMMDKSGLLEWQKRVGVEEAEKIAREITLALVDAKVVGAVRPAARARKGRKN